MHMRNLKEFKIELRKKYRGIREKTPQDKRDIMDRRIKRRFLVLDRYEKSPIIFTYVSKKIEVDTYRIIQEAWEDKKLVAVPKCNASNKSMDFYIIKTIDDLEKGMFGVYEPIESRCELVTDLARGVCIVPGFCFDSHGYRLGYGHGYYDRFLTRFKGTTVGLCYSNCMNYKLPHGKYDKVVDILVTDKYIKTFFNAKNSFRTKHFNYNI